MRSRCRHCVCVPPVQPAVQPVCPNRPQSFIIALGWQRLLRALCCTLAVAFVVLPWIPGPWVQDAFAQEAPEGADEERSGRNEAGSGAMPVTPPMIDESTAELRWSDFRASLNGADEDRTFEAFRTVSQELGYTLLPAHASALHREARQAMAAGDLELADRRLAQARRLSPRDSQVLWGKSERSFFENPWALHEWTPLVVSALRSEWRTPAGRHALSSWFADVANRVCLWVFVSGLLLMMLKYGARLAFDLRLVLGRIPTWRQMQVIVVLGFAAVALAAPLWVTGCIMGFGLALYAGRRDVPLVVATALASLVAVSPIQAPEYDIESAEWIATAPGSPCAERCVAALERASSEGFAAASVALAWTHYRRGNTASLTQARELLDTIRTDGEAAAWQSLLLGHLATISADFPLAEQHYRQAAEHTRDRETRATITVSLSRVAMATNDTATARQLVQAAAEAGHPLLEQWTGYQGRSQNSLLPSWHMSTSGVLAHFRAEGVETRARWLGATDGWPFYVVGSFFMGLLVALVLHRTGIRSEACQSCGTPTSRFVLAAAHRDHHCVWCFQATTRSVQLSFDEQQARDWRAESRLRRLKRTDWLTVWFAPGASLWLHFSPLAGVALWLTASAAFGLMLTDERWLCLLGEGSPLWSVIRPVWLGYGLLALMVVSAVLVTRRAHDGGGGA